MLSIRAVRCHVHAVHQGGEVCINYLGRGSLRPQAERQEALLSGYAFSCTCARCASEATLMQEQEGLADLVEVSAATACYCLPATACLPAACLPAAACLLLPANLSSGGLGCPDSKGRAYCGGSGGGRVDRGQGCGIKGALTAHWLVG